MATVQNAVLVHIGDLVSAPGAVFRVSGSGQVAGAFVHEDMKLVHGIYERGIRGRRRRLCPPRRSSPDRKPPPKS